MSELREKVARSLYEHFVGEDFLNEYAPWADLEGKLEWLERADVVLAIPEIREGLYLYSRKKVKAGKPSREPTLGHSIGTKP
jgi:hypothetical protein